MAEKLTPQQKRDRATNELIIRTLMQDPQGRRWLWLWLGKCHIFESTISFGHNSFGVTAFNEGQRAIGLELLADITRLEPKAYVLMANESAPEKEEEDDGTSDSD